MVFALAREHKGKTGEKPQGNGKKHKQMVTKGNKNVKIIQCRKVCLCKIHKKERYFFNKHKNGQSKRKNVPYEKDE